MLPKGCVHAMTTLNFICFLSSFQRIPRGPRRYCSARLLHAQVMQQQIACCRVKNGRFFQKHFRNLIKPGQCWPLWQLCQKLYAALCIMADPFAMSIHCECPRHFMGNVMDLQSRQCALNYPSLWS